MADARLSMAALAQKWSDLLLADLAAVETPTAAAATSGSLLRPPATEAEVEAAETRLGVRLPASYREFLLVSNGAYADQTGVSLVWDNSEGEKPPPESDVVGVGFLPVQDVTWLRDADPGYAAFMADRTELGAMVPATTDGESMPSWVPVAKGLRVATYKAPGTTVLIPFPGLDEWQLWTHWKEDGTAYVSFRSYLEYEVAGLEAWYPSQDEVRALVEGPAETWVWRARRLKCVASEDALGLLVACAASGRLEARAAVTALGQIGTPAARQALVEVRDPLDQYAIGVLARLDPATAADVFAQRGAFYWLWRLGDARAVPLAAAALRDGTRFTQVAAQVLGRWGDIQHIPTLLAAFPRAAGSDRAVVASALHDVGAPEGERYLRELAAAPDYGWAYMARYYLERIERRGQASPD